RCSAGPARRADHHVRRRRARAAGSDHSLAPALGPRRVKLASTVAFVAGAVAAAATVQTPAPVLSPRDELKTITLPAGYRLELVASEPLVRDPVVIDWDGQGRLWVVEMAGYMNDTQAGHEHDPTGRVVVLEDTNGDGTMDKRTVFADGLVLPRALKVLDQGVLVGEPPNLWFMKDA